MVRSGRARAFWPFSRGGGGGPPAVAGVTFVTGEPGAAVADAAAVAALWRAAAPVPGVSGADEARVAAALAGCWGAVAAYDAAGALVGVARVVSDGVFAALLVDVAVAPAWRGRGVGRGLVARVAADARARGASSVVAFVPPGKRLFMQRCGFRVSTAYRLMRHEASEG